MFPLEVTPDVAATLPKQEGPPLALDVATLAITGHAEATSSRLVEVTNLSAQPVRVALRCETPWVELVPADLELRPGVPRSFRVRARRPPVDAEHGAAAEVLLVPAEGAPLRLPVRVRARRHEDLR
jgi:hypothetical protein